MKKTGLFSPVPGCALLTFETIYLLHLIAPQGKLRVVADGVETAPREIRSRYRKVRPLAALRSDVRGWTLDVLKSIHTLGKSQFSLREVYALETDLAKMHPKNRNVRPKIRQQLQVLRDLGLIQFLGDGEYCLRS
jgi:type II restriction enzyme